MEEKIEALEKSVSSITKELLELKELLGTGLTKVGSNFGTIEKEIGNLHVKIDLLNKKVDLLEGSTSDGLEDVGLKLENLTEEITKISAVTNYDQEYKNMQGLN